MLSIFRFSSPKKEDLHYKKKIKNYWAKLEEVQNVIGR